LSILYYKRGRKVKKNEGIDPSPTRRITTETRRAQRIYLLFGEHHREPDTEFRRTMSVRTINGWFLPRKNTKIFSSKSEN
jgi:hypothetical protein